MGKKIVSIVFNSFENDSRVLKENISFKKAGFDVEILALWKSGVKEIETLDNGVFVRRLKRKKKNSNTSKRFNGFIGRVQKLLNIPSYLLFFMRFVKEAKTADIIHCNDLNTLPVGVLVRKFYNKNVKIVYDAHEYETEEFGINGIKKSISKIIEKSCIHYADAVITVSDSIANEYVRLYGIEKPALVLNTPSYVDIDKKNIFRETLGIKENQTIFLYQGGFSKNRGIEILLEVFKNIDSHEVVIVFMGYGPLESLIAETSNQCENIFLHKAVSPDVLLDYTSSADFGILFYENTCLNHYYCSPNKMFEYLMAGIPVIASNLYEMKKLVESYKVGVVANENTSEGLKEAIDRVVGLNKEELQANIYNAKAVYNWEEQEKNLLKVYKEIVIRKEE